MRKSPSVVRGSRPWPYPAILHDHQFMRSMTVTFIGAVPFTVASLFVSLARRLRVSASPA